MDVPPVDQSDKFIRCASDTVVEKYWMEFGTADRLGLFVPQYQFFSIALPYLYGGFHDGLLAQFMSEYPQPVPFMHHRFHKPLFAGMEAAGSDGEWNHVLWALPREIWIAFEMFVVSLVLWQDLGERTGVIRYGAQDLEIVDPLYADKGRAAFPVPMLPIVVLGVNGSRCCMATQKPANLDALPQARAFPPQDGAVKMAQAIHACHRDGGSLAT